MTLDMEHGGKPNLIKRMTYQYNQNWEKFIRSNPTQAEILQEGKNLMIEQNIQVYY